MVNQSEAIQARNKFLDEMKQAPEAFNLGHLEFTPSSWGTFDAELSFDGDNFLIHFFLPEKKEDLFQACNVIHAQKPFFAEKYWNDTFPMTLSDAARTYFKVEYPRIAAKRVREEGVMTVPRKPLEEVQGENGKEYKLQEKGRPLDSWWFIATGFGNVLDPQEYVRRFFVALDQELRKRTARNGR